MSIVATALADPDVRVRNAARAALAEIGGGDAAGALAQTRHGLESAERGELQAALAWLGDDRDLPATRELAFEHLGEPQRRGYGHERGAWLAVPALLRLGTAADRAALVDAAIKLVTDVEVPDPTEPWRVPSLRAALNTADHLIWHLSADGFSDDADRAIATLTALGHAVGLHAARMRDARAVRREPLLPRSIPRLAMHEELQMARPQTDVRPAAKFGGQPDWIDQPSWPLSTDGAPMIFLAQLPLLGSPPRTAYVFFNAQADNTWDPLGEGNAVVLQPGASPHTPAGNQLRGPQLFEVVYEPHRYRQVGKMRRYERFILLDSDADPIEWVWRELPAGSYPTDGHGDWNKIGGTPLFLQAPQWPLGEGWEFAFQFNAGWAGRELGDGAECYGFVTADGRGAFLWQCH